MTPGEQAHSLRVLERLQRAGESDPDLMRAALLHDAGKVRSPLSLPDRALIVLGKRFLPGRVKRWGEGEARGIQRAFVVAAQHPAWGAEMAAQAGATARTCDLIRRHQEEAGEDRLLRALQEADDFE
jgi:hypothetical protein